MPKRTEHPATQDSTTTELLAQAAAHEDARIDAAETARANRR